MKHIILVRHGKAEEHRSGMSDFERKLQKRGRNDAKIIAEVVFKYGVKPDCFISSDAVRAFETASIFAQVMGVSENQISTERFIYDGYTTGQLIDFIKEIDNEKSCAIVFGHNPFISQFGIRLSKNFHRSFPTAGCLMLNFDQDNWNIEPETGEIGFFEFPKKYR